MALVRSFGVQGGPWSVDNGHGGRDERLSDEGQMEWEPLGAPCRDCGHFAPDHSIGCTLRPMGHQPTIDPLDMPEVQAALAKIRPTLDTASVALSRVAAPQPGQKPNRGHRKRR